jgi:hypothetical protein
MNSFNPFDRIYYPVWHQLKSMPPKDATSIGVSLTARKHLHPRIIKALNKEKWQDTGFRLALLEKYQRARLRHSSRYSVLTFYLDYSFSMEDLGLK